MAYIYDDDECAIPTSVADLESGHILATHGTNYSQIGSRLPHAYWDTDVVKYAMGEPQWRLLTITRTIARESTPTNPPRVAASTKRRNNGPMLR